MHLIIVFLKYKAAELAGRPHEVAGMLLYAGTDEEVYPEQRYRMSGNWIEVRTLDLDGEFSEIRRQLDGIAERYFGESVPAQILE